MIPEPQCLHFAATTTETGVKCTNCGKEFDSQTDLAIESRDRTNAVQASIPGEGIVVDPETLQTLASRKGIPDAS